MKKEKKITITYTASCSKIQLEYMKVSILSVLQSNNISKIFFLFILEAKNADLIDFIKVLGISNYEIIYLNKNDKILNSEFDIKNYYLYDTLIPFFSKTEYSIFLDNDMIIKTDLFKLVKKQKNKAFAILGRRGG